VYNPTRYWASAAAGRGASGQASYGVRLGPWRSDRQRMAVVALTAMRRECRCLTSACGRASSGSGGSCTGRRARWRCRAGVGQRGDAVADGPSTTFRSRSLPAEAVGVPGVLGWDHPHRSRSPAWRRSPSTPQGSLRLVAASRATDPRHPRETNGCPTRIGLPSGDGESCRR
jgi:hypothetical protein